MRLLHTIRGRLILIQWVIIILAMTIAGNLIYRNVSKILEKNNKESYEAVLCSSDKIVEDKLEAVNSITKLILSNRIVQESLKNNVSDKVGGLMEEGVFQAFNQALSEYATDMGIYSLYVINNSGEIFYIDPNRNLTEVLENYDYTKVKEEAWLRHARAAKGRSIYWGYNVTDSSSNSFSCIKILNSTDTYDEIGVLILNLKADLLDNCFPREHSKEEAYFVTFEEGREQHLVYSQNDDIFNEGKSVINDVLQGKYFVTKYPSNIQGWKLWHMIERGSILKNIDRIKNITSMVTVVAAVIASIVMFFVSISITRNLYKLKEAIKKVGKGERNLPDIFGKDEVGEIGNELRKMVNENLAMSDRLVKYELMQKEAEMQVLQAQINPHFLYNTLDSVYWMAMLEKQQKIAEMIRAMSEIFKTSLSKGDKFITIREEIQFIKNYLLLQNVRFNGKFQVQIHIDDDLYEYKIIKLILQPFIENAVYHGLEPKLGKGNIKIGGYVWNGVLYFDIEDDGVGMRDMKEIEKGYGVRNVIERIHLYYGIQYGIDFDTTAEKGTKVRVKLPYDVKYFEEEKNVQNSTDR